MRLQTLAALIGLAFSATAFAAPLTQNTAAPSVINSAPSGEQSLQQIANGLFGAGHINVNTDQSSAGMFSSTTPDYATTIPTLVAEFTSNSSTQSFGIWFGTDTSNVVRYDLLLGAAGPKTAVGLSIDNGSLDVFGKGCGTQVQCGSFSNALINPTSFGFYFKSSANSPAYYSLDSLNTGVRKDRVVALQDGKTTNWLFAYEDGTDFDYNDMAVKVESINVAAVPEPETYSLMLVGLGVMGFIALRRKAAR